jgi:UDP-N-acetylmuramate dehydrogenase
MTMALKDDLRGAGFQGEIQAEAPLAPMTTWRIGGSAELLANPANVDDVRCAIAWANGRELPWRVLGNGSNLLVSDDGVRGLVLRVRKVLDRVDFSGSGVVAGAGASFPALANAAAERGLSGIEFGAGIPGCVGGAIVMNAGWHQFELGSVVKSVTYLEDDGLDLDYRHESCHFGYRTSVFRGRKGVVLHAELALTPDDPAAVKDRLQHFSESRKASQPTEFPSCGSVFLKVEGDFAGRLIEAAGLKGRRVGGIQVSEKHANFFVNLGGGTAKEALALVELVERKVFDTFEVKLTREFEFWSS